MIYLNDLKNVLPNNLKNIFLYDINRNNNLLLDYGDFKDIFESRNANREFKYLNFEVCLVKPCKKGIDIFINSKNCNDKEVKNNGVTKN